MSDINPQSKSKDEDKPNRGKGVRCNEYEGFGHIKAGFPTFLKKQNKRFSITWSDSDDENEGETTNKVMSFTKKYDYGSESSNEEITIEELAKTYILFLT